MTALSVRDIGKAYRSYQSEWHRFARWFGLPVKLTEETWVLRHINFNIQPGEAIGIVGQNGAGKSTLLKIIVGTTRPTDGQVHINGRIAAILELGMGFNPDLTGRENVYHAAGLMGFSHENISGTMEQIEAFAEIGDYFDEPMRTYSSGMQVRIAFAVATAWRPEILIVDEALSVGDTYFQHKSFDRIRAFQKQGTTLLIVSHDRNAVQAVCNRAILLERGAVIKDGNPEQVFDFYNALISEKETDKIEFVTLKNGKTQTKSGSGEVDVKGVTLLNDRGEVSEYFRVGETIQLRVKVNIEETVDSLVLGYAIKDRLGQVLYGTNTWHTLQVLDHPLSDSEYTYLINFEANLGVGTYSISVALHDRETHLNKCYFWQDLSLIFNVYNDNKVLFNGAVWLPQSIEIVTLANKGSDSE